MEAIEDNYTSFYLEFEEKWTINGIYFIKYNYFPAQNSLLIVFLKEMHFLWK